MPARDLHHDIVKSALIKDGWTITHDPLRVQWGKKDLYVDLGAERLLAAEKGEQKIAVEVKSFIGKSEIADLEQALGQFVLYRNIMEFTHPGRELYLAVRELVFVELFEEPVGQLLIDRHLLQLVIFDDQLQEIVRWIP
jgi:hypothetical protein